jgi:MFS superfamily sulfate permease-like transporter
LLNKELGYYTRSLDRDIPAGIVVFLVAFPLCLGIAVASGAPPFSGVIAGIVSGLIVAVLSGSQLSVSGPTATLSIIVAAAIEKLELEGLLLAVCFAGVFQIAMGLAHAGVIGAYFPVAVIEGMIAAVGLILIMKEAPYAIGYGSEADTALSFLQNDSPTAFWRMMPSLDTISAGAIILALISIGILIAWDSKTARKYAFFSLVPGPLVVFIVGVAYNALAQTYAPGLAIPRQHLVTLPLISGPSQLLGEIRFPDFSQYANSQVYFTALALALVASLESLLSLEAVDKLDPMKRTAPANRELMAQGVGNLISGLVGGLPIAAVIVRSSANINAGAHTKLSCILHGAILLISVMFFSRPLNMIPMACLAAVLLQTGYKLTNPKLLINQYRKGFYQFIPFAVTIVAILATDLLKGMAIGVIVGLFFVLYTNYQSAFKLVRDGNNYLLRLQKDASFLNKAPLRSILSSIGDDASVVIDGTRATFIDYDIAETLNDFMKAAPDRNIKVERKNLRLDW